MVQLLAAPFSQFFDANGDPLSGGKVYTYAAGTTTPQNSYTDSGAGTPAANPVILDSAGRAAIWLSGSYKIVVKDSADVIIVTTDNIVASGGTITEDQTYATGAQVLLDDSITSAGANLPLAFDGDTNTGLFRATADTLGFATGGVEACRINGSGHLLYGVSASSAIVGINALGIVLGAQSDGTTAIGAAQFSRQSGTALFVNRASDDGTLVGFYQDGSLEGSVSVSTTTVSYNTFLGSHWSQLSNGSKPDILRGTVMETINEMCEWPEEQNDRLPKCKISDTEASKAVYGVFLNWDNDWDVTNDMCIAALGAGYVRMASDQSPQMGNLVESNGDGSARVQADDIIRASTIGKVSSTIVSENYDDGSFVVPCVLMCG